MQFLADKCTHNSASFSACKWVIKIFHFSSKCLENQISDCDLKVLLFAKQSPRRLLCSKRQLSEGSFWTPPRLPSAFVMQGSVRCAKLSLFRILQSTMQELCTLEAQLFSNPFMQPWCLCFVTMNTQSLPQCHESSCQADSWYWFWLTSLFQLLVWHLTLLWVQPEHLSLDSSSDVVTD